MAPQAATRSPPDGSYSTVTVMFSIPSSALHASPQPSNGKIIKDERGEPTLAQTAPDHTVGGRGRQHDGGVAAFRAAAWHDRLMAAVATLADLVGALATSAA